MRRITVAEPANSGEVYGTPVHETEVWHIGLVLEPEGLVVVDATKDVSRETIESAPDVKRYDWDERERQLGLRV